VNPSVVARGKQLAADLAGSRPARAWHRYGRARGGVLAGGIAYTGLFSVFSALLVGFTVLGLVVGRRSELQQAVLQAVDEQLPGLLKGVGGDGGLVPVDRLFAPDVLSLTGIVALLVALVSGLGWLDAVREGIRATFDLGTDRRPVVRKKLLDVAILASLGLAILLSAVLSLVVNAAGGALLRGVGLAGGWAGQALLQLFGVLVVLALDTAILVILLRLLSGVPLAWPQVRAGALVGAVGLGLLKLFGGVLLGRAGGNNPLLATSAVLVGLLLWMSLMSRVTLLAAAWVATDDDVHRQTEPIRVGGLAAAVPRQDLPVQAGPRGLLEPSFGQRSHDRVTLAAGAVLGVLAATSLRVLGGAGRAVADVVRRD
jgi:membrane protein